MHFEGLYKSAFEGIVFGTFPIPTEGWIEHMVAEATRFDRWLANRVRVGLPLAIRCRKICADEHERRVREESAGRPR